MGDEDENPFGGMGFEDLEKEYEKDLEEKQKEVDAERGFTEEELDTCVRVLQLLKGRETEVGRTPAYRKLRDAVSPLVGDGCIY